MHHERYQRVRARLRAAQASIEIRIPPGIRHAEEPAARLLLGAHRVVVGVIATRSAGEEREATDKQAPGNQAGPGEAHGPARVTRGGSR